MDNVKEKSLLQESLVKLYLRLNGYFTSGFIVHSETHGKNKTEIDILAIRLPYNSEPEREVGPSKFLPLGKNITNILICEVKARGQQLQFNDSLRSHPDRIKSILRWVGVFKENEIGELPIELARAMSPKNANKENITSIEGPRNIAIIPLISSPERKYKRDNQPFFLYGDEIFNYVWQCMCPAEPRECCATHYDFTGWGREFYPIVNYFKSRAADDGPGSMKDLYKYLNI
jgi:hypothetical protein